VCEGKHAKQPDTLEDMAAIGSRMNVIVKNTFLVAQEIDDMDDSCRTRSRSYSDSEIEYCGSRKGKCKMDWDSAASTNADDSDEEPTDTIHSDDDISSCLAIQPPPGNWTPQVQQSQFAPLCVAVIPFVVVSQPVWPQKSSRSARRRRARAMNRWYRCNAMASEDHQLPAIDDDCADEFDCEFQFSEDDIPASLDLDEAESWPETAPKPDQSEKIYK
jgi:hypothetical protein